MHLPTCTYTRVSVEGDTHADTQVLFSPFYAWGTAALVPPMVTEKEREERDEREDERGCRDRKRETS